MVVPVTQYLKLLAISECSRLKSRSAHRVAAADRRTSQFRRLSALGTSTMPEERERSRDRRDRRRDDSRDRRRRRSYSRSRSRSATPPPRQRRRPTGFSDAPPPGFSGADGAVGGAGVPPGMGIGGAGIPPGMNVSVAGAPSGFSGPPPGYANAHPGNLGLNPVPNQQATRHARRVYVGNLPGTVTEPKVAAFFNNALHAIGGTVAALSGDPCLNVYINYEKKFAFVEFRTVEETSNCMALDGAVLEGIAMRVRRPNDYNVMAASSLGPSQPKEGLNLEAIGLNPAGAAAGGATNASLSEEDLAHRLFIGGLPYFLTEAMVKELVEAFGPTKQFQLVVDRETGNSKGYGFFVYQDHSVTDVACQGLHGMKMGEKSLTVQRAMQGGAGAPKPTAASASGHAALPGADEVAAHLAGVSGAPAVSVPPPPSERPASRVVSLTEMLDVEELRDDVEYGEIMEDMREECGKFGRIESIVIPRPDDTAGEAVPGLGKVFVCYEDQAGAASARNALHGRKFGGNVVKADFIDEAVFASRAF